MLPATPGNSAPANNAAILGEFPPYLYVKPDPYLLNIRRHPLEEIQNFIIVDGVRVAQLLGKFVNACENKQTLINKVITTTGCAKQAVLACLHCSH